MRRFIVVLLSAGLTLVLGAQAAHAQNPHFVPSNPAVFTDLGTQLQVTGTIAGLGQEPLIVTVEADAVADVACFNPGTSTGPVPGQAQTLTVAGTTGEVLPNRQGRFILTAGLLVTAAPTVTGAEACPNPRWTAVVTDVTFSNIRVFVEQPIGTEPVLIATFPGTL
jgi:hypothetical protein